MTREQLIRKYNVPAPRYTSYPTVPLWNQEMISSNNWMQIVKKAFDETNQTKGISLFIHLPFCEALCTYCACNKRITKNHKVEGGYIEAILSEWHQYLDHLGEKPVLKELHLGGGTPTFFSPENLQFMLTGILNNVIIHPEHDFGFEGHPNNTTEEHLKTLYELGFNRVSFGIQDFNPKVQFAIHRLQPLENVIKVTETARRIGYTSVNYDLIYGLPFQTPETVADTLDKTCQLMPDRIAFYSYAHVPWNHPGQRGYSEADLPTDENKRVLYEMGRKRFLAMGYKDIGMDHFALPGDSLYVASENQTLHRNFMGYTVCNTELLIGLGTSAISDAKYGYMQNEKVVEKYKEKVLKGEMAALKGHIMSEEDLIIRKRILELLRSGYIILDDKLLAILGEAQMEQFHEMKEEGLLIANHEKLQVTETGKAFIRNIAMVLDVRLHRSKPAGSPVFSRAI